MKVSALITLLTVSLLVACGGTHKEPELENPFVVQASNHMQNGLSSMQYENWESAKRSFSRALEAAELADNIQLVVHSWYNIAVIHATLKDSMTAKHAYQRVIDLTTSHPNKTMQMRAKLALALIEQREDNNTSQVSLNSFPSKLFIQTEDWPADIQLQAARLAARLKQQALAHSAYTAVILKTGKHRGLLLMKAKAHVGLALLAQGNAEPTTAWNEAEKALYYCRKIGAPRLTAHALLLQGQLHAYSDQLRKDKLERALTIYNTLKDEEGQYKSKLQLKNIQL